MPKRETASNGVNEFLAKTGNLDPGHMVCRWGGCNDHSPHIGGYCEKHRKAAQAKSNGDDGSDHTHNSRNPVTETEIAEIRRRMSRFEDPKTIARDLGITKATLFNVLRKR